MIVRTFKTPTSARYVIAPDERRIFLCYQPNVVAGSWDWRDNPRFLYSLPPDYIEWLPEL